MSADAGVWIFLLLIASAVGLMVRSISKASLRRLEGRTGAETVQDRNRKRKERQERQAAREQAKDGDDTADSGTKGRPGAKKRRKRAGHRGSVGTTKHTKGAAPEPKLAEAPAPKPSPEPAPEAPQSDLLLPPGKALGEGLSRTRTEGFVGRLGRLFKGKTVDAGLLDSIEEVLFTADIGVRTSEKLLEGLRASLKRKELNDEERIWGHLREQANGILEGVDSTPSPTFGGKKGAPHVVLVVGVNGAGKTTTIGKLAHRAAAQGKGVVIGAGDTFRAAAVEQLGVWGSRVGAEVVSGKDGGDPSAVLFDAVSKAKESGAELVLLDTAGRLHTNVNLVQELKKVHRVIGKALPGAPHEVLLVLDATNGQNAIAQAHTFGEAMGVTGIVLTKLDGTAKGGVVLGIYDELKLPIQWIGVGERTEDLRPFDRGEFIDALFEQAGS